MPLLILAKLSATMPSAPTLCKLGGRESSTLAVEAHFYDGQLHNTILMCYRSSISAPDGWEGLEGGRTRGIQADLDAVDGAVFLVGHHPYQRKGGVAGKYEVATPMCGLRRITIWHSRIAAVQGRIYAFRHQAHVARPS